MKVWVILLLLFCIYESYASVKFTRLKLKPLRSEDYGAARKTVSELRKRSTIPIELEGGYIGNYGMFTVEIAVGTPPQLINPLFDTVTATLTLPLAGCDSCGSEQYNYTNSATASPIPYVNNLALCSFPYKSASDHEFCGFNQSYITQGNGAPQISGFLLSDMVGVVGASPLNMTFGVFDYSSHRYADVQFSGVIGFGMDSIAQPGTTSWFSAAVAAGQFPNIFSICMGPYSGSLILGGTESSLYKTEILYTPMAKTNVYEIVISDILVGKQSSGVSIGAPNSVMNPTIVDTTVPEIIFSLSVIQNLNEEVQKQYCVSGAEQLPGLCTIDNLFFGECYSIDSSLITSYPTITIMLTGNVPLSLDPALWLIKDGSNAKYCSAITAAKEKIAATILGTLLFKKFYAVIDMSKHQIGFAEAANCSDSEYLIDIVSGNYQRHAIGQNLPEQLKVSVKNFTTHAYTPGVTVVWTVAQGNGTLSSESVVSDENGIAAVTYKLGMTEGENLITAQVDQAFNSPLFFHCTGHKSYYLGLWGIICLFFLITGLIVALIYSTKIKREKLEKMKSSITDEMREKVLERAMIEATSNPEPIDSRDVVYWPEAQLVRTDQSTGSEKNAEEQDNQIIDITSFEIIDPNNQEDTPTRSNFGNYDLYAKGPVAKVKTVSRKRSVSFSEDPTESSNYQSYVDPDEEEIL